MNHDPYEERTWTRQGFGFAGTRIEGRPRGEDICAECPTNRRYEEAKIFLGSFALIRCWNISTSSTIYETTTIRHSSQQQRSDPT